MLLHSAMPYEYVPSENATANQVDELFNFSIYTDQQQEDNENIFVRENEVHISDSGKSGCFCFLQIIKTEISENYTRSPKLARNQRIIIKPKEQGTPNTSKKSVYTDILEELDQSMREEMASHISTFIFKGEEYVQMPKKDYLHERDLYLRQIRKYKNLFHELKSTLNSFDDQ